MNKWPIRFTLYGAGDAASGYASLESDIRAQLDELSGVATNHHLAAVAQLDRDEGDAIRWVLDSRNRYSRQNAGEPNTGDPSELIAFFDWAESQCPAEHHVMILSGHGLAWQDDIVLDDLGRARKSESSSELYSVPHFKRKPISRSRASARDTRAILMDGDTEGGYQDFLTNVELALALSEIADRSGSRIEAVIFDACLMSSLEVLTELTDSVDVVVGGVDEISGKGFNLAGAAKKISEGRVVNSHSIGRAFADAYDPADTDSCIAIDIQSPGFKMGIAKFAQFADRVHAWLDKGIAVSKARMALRRASAQHLKYRASVADIRELYYGFKIEGLDADSLEILHDCVVSLSSSIVGKKLGADYTEFLGLSVYSPATQDDFKSNRNEFSRLRFSQSTGWASVLDRVFNS